MKIKIIFKDETIKLVSEDENCLNKKNNCLNKKNTVTTITIPSEISKKQLIDLIKKSDCLVIKKDLTK